MTQEADSQVAYLHSFRSEAYPAEITSEFLTQTSQVLTPNILVQVLTEAYDHLTKIPGPNITFRQAWAPKWVGWWLNGFSEVVKQASTDELLYPCDRVVQPSDVAKTIAKYEAGGDSGLIMMGGGEGTPGHRLAADWVIEHTDKPVLALGPREWVRRKVRIDYFLPPEVILSMWSYYRNEYISPSKPWFVLTYMPDNNGDMPDDQYFEQMFKVMGTDFCFASEDDPQQEAKRARGRSSRKTLIPSNSIARTTDMVRKLTPDYDLE